MLTDSHCHLNLLDLTDFNNQLDNVISAALNNDVNSLLCVCVNLTDYPILCNIANKYRQVKISVGLHPNNPVDQEPKAETLVELANQHRACIAIGETGLDYYRVHEAHAQKQQRDRFREHIHAAIASQKPLIIHTRQAAEDTLQVMADENASQIGGVMHCFAEDLSIAEQAIDMNFYISLSGIVTFKNATTLHEVARKIPLDRLLIETDSPYLAPVPYRGKQNHPALVKYVAQAISELRQINYEQVAIQTTKNFKRCFKLE
ncbi:TatD family hydrolase [Legionella sp. CNM-1927-20]|uniref:TatD family hydrolase n=1 Tax=Legionella sp. CNM-1927-20 TaxID=3422221 RepID=UPI00403AA3BE